MTAIIFDFDGTIADSSACIRQCVAYAFDKIGLAEIDYCKISITQQDLATTFRTSLTKAGMPVDDKQLMDFINHYRTHHQEEAEHHIALFDGAESVLEAMKSEYKLGIATTKPSDEAIRVIQKLGIEHYFDHIQGTDKGLRYKPAPDIILKTLETLEVPASNAVYVGDAAHDMEAAKSAGVKAVAAAYGFAGDESLKREDPHFLIYNLTELHDLHHKFFLPEFN